jgi:hypothetical protein
MSIIGATYPSIGGTDQHCGFYYIPSGLTVTIVSNKQSVTFGILDIDGAIVIDGQLISEP